MTEKNVEKIVSLAKRRGFVFQSSDIYGGLNGCWDYGPMGVELLKNIKDEWWKNMTYRHNIEGLDASILMHPGVWKASGHVDNFTDPMIDCKKCRARFRIDTLSENFNEKKKKKFIRSLTETVKEKNPEIEELLSSHNESEAFDHILDNSSLASYLLPILNCPVCGNKESFTEPRNFNLMFKTFLGPLEDSKNTVFLRPETAQGIFVNFTNVLNSGRQKIPFGIAQIGKAFRNEINTKNFLFRTREFEQMEMEFFVKPDDDNKYFEFWKESRMEWYKEMGIDPGKLRFSEHPSDKLAHYAKEAVDIEYKFPFGWGEIEGIHNRTDYDLSKHEEHSKKSQHYFDEVNKMKFIPNIIETSAGASRSFMAFLLDAYNEEEVNNEKRIVMKFKPRLAPVKIAIFPLVNKDGLPEIARKIEKDLRSSFRIFFDDKGAVGRRYRRMDEIGTPFCLTVDHDTLSDGTVTIRDRDSMEQERIHIEDLRTYFDKNIRH